MVGNVEASGLPAPERPQHDAAPPMNQQTRVGETKSGFAQGLAFGPPARLRPEPSRLALQPSQVTDYVGDMALDENFRCLVVKGS